MTERARTISPVVIGAMALGMLALPPYAATAQDEPGPPAPGAVPGPMLEYAVKVVCGRQPMNPVMPVAQGVYYTAVNVHNPGAPQKFKRKVAVALPGKVGPVSTFLWTGLANDQAIEFDCGEISKQSHMDGFLKGFLVIQSSFPLDIVAVYTAAPLNNPHVSTLHTERVPPRRM
jgi:hypothetical protein